MALIPEGTWACKVLSASAGLGYKNLFSAMIHVEITEGPGKGRRETYERAVDSKSIKFIGPSCKAVGHVPHDVVVNGKTQSVLSFDTLAEDCAAWIAKTGGVSTVDIKHFPLKSEEAIAKAIARAKAKGEEPELSFAKINAIGRGPKPLTEAPAEIKADADAALRMFMGAGGETAPVGDEDDIPFATCSVVESSIARVLRGAL